jgi:hypothetical protein
MNNPENKVWYKQFWPWFLIIVPLTSMVVSFTMMNFAFTTQDSMVVDDYYKEGKGINVKLQAIERAKALNIQADVRVTNDAIEVSFASGQNIDGQALVVDFYHSTQEHKDFSVNVFKDAQNVYRAPIENATNGKWRVSLHPMDESWKLQKQISLPNQSQFTLVP